MTVMMMLTNLYFLATSVCRAPQFEFEVNQLDFGHSDCIERLLPVGDCMRGFLCISLAILAIAYSFFRHSSTMT